MLILLKHSLQTVAIIEIACKDNIKAASITWTITLLVLLSLDNAILILVLYARNPIAIYRSIY
jgi:hypothetical protein